MEFDLILFIAIAIIGPIFGGKMCAVLEKKVTGKVRHGNEFKIKRMKSNLISIAISYIATFQITSLIYGKITHALDWVIRALSIAMGISIYLLLHRSIYRILIRNYQDFAN
jgi:mannitol-specific phosphotransferase system IIBC component